MVLTACVAVWMAVIRTSTYAVERSAPLPGFDPLLTTLGTLYGMGAGAALAGLILFAARRLRRIPFPTHPGEYLLVYSAVGVTLQLGMHPLYQLLAHFSMASPASGWFFFLFPVATLAAHVAVFIWALVHVKRWRWRVFLLSIPLCYTGAVGLIWFTSMTASPASNLRMIPTVALFIPSIFLAVVVIQDHLEGRRYPWSHWMGVALRFWFDAMQIVTLLWSILTWEASP